MSLKQWADNGWLKPHRTSRKEIGSLLRIVERDLNDAQGDISADWRFGIAYNAALKLCRSLLSAEGYRPSHELQHYRTLAALPEVLGKAKKADAEYLDDCRKKRNIVEYDEVGGASESDADELVGFVKGFKDEVIAWLTENHPELL
ncbi:MAG: hypothetical protein A2Y66_01480 [Nitrospirae bacterium RBG_13_41_22]|nr:MAG: hypothetical protein A2Y66_01480 [Nitrospirae bacterium RBG_13_41_22]